VSKGVSDESFHSYSRTVDRLLALKKEAQETKNNYGDTKSINAIFDEHKFNVMATSIMGFSILLRNNDCSIALRKTKSKINPSPVIKVEFRAEFLARHGYRKCADIINNFVSKHLLDDYKIKISEIHLATDIQGYNFTHLDFFKMKTRARKSQTHNEETDYAKASVYGGVTTFTGFTFGGGDYHLRIYNKTVEIARQKNKAFAKTLLWQHKANYNPDLTVWRIEIQIRRSKLKKLINSDNSTMDDYVNVLAGIPDLWSKALSDYTIKDISDNDSFNLLRGYRVLKNGNSKLLTKNAIYAIFKRADSLPFWEDLKIWNGHGHNPVNTAYKVPTAGSFDYVSNSIKSLYSTLAKHYGSTDTKTILKAFEEANIQNLEKKQISLLEDCFNKQLDWFERIDFMADNGVLSVPYYKDLERHIITTLIQSNNVIHDVNYSNDIKERVEARLAFPCSNYDKVELYANY